MHSCLSFQEYYADELVLQVVCSLKIILLEGLHQCHLNKYSIFERYNIFTAEIISTELVGIVLLPLCTEQDTFLQVKVIHTVMINRSHQ